MPIYFDSFHQQKVDRLKNHLVLMAEKNKPKFYEIFVDALKAIPKTDEPSEFDGYEDYMSADTEQIKIVIYNGVSSPRNDQYVFLLKAKSREEATDLGLNGTQAQAFSRTSLNDWRESQSKRNAEIIELQQLRHRISELEKELEESEQYADELAAAVEAAKENGNKIGGMHVGDILSVALEGIVRRNTHIIAQLPAVSGLAGIIEKDNERGTQIAEPQPETEVTFKKKVKQEVVPAPTEQQKEFLLLFEELQKHFEESEIGQVLDILDALSNDKSKLQPTLELLQETK